MAQQELIDYIMHQRVHGASTANIRNALLHAGWEEVDVEKGMKLTEKMVPSPKKEPEVVIKPDGKGQAGPVTQPEITKHAPIGTIIALIFGIIVVAAAAIFLYVRFLMPSLSAPSASVKPVLATSSETLPVSPGPVEQTVTTTSTAPAPVVSSSTVGVQDVVPVAASGTATTVIQ